MSQLRVRTPEGRSVVKNWKPVGVLLMALLVGITSTACDANRATDSLAVTPLPTVTVVQTQLVTPTPTKVAPRVAAPKPTPKPTPKPAPVRKPQPASDPNFDRAYLRTTVEYVIDDIKEADIRAADGDYGGVASSLSLMSGSFGYMQNAGIPPRVNQADYVARLQTLESFAEQASDELYDDQIINGMARYEVIRKQTGVLFRKINSALGTNYKLPRR